MHRLTRFTKNAIAKRRQLRAAILVTILTLFLAALFGGGCGVTVTPPAPFHLQAAGSTSLAPLFTVLAAAYVKQRPHVTYDLESTGSQLGYRLVETGQVEIGLISWLPDNGLGSNLRLVPVARDGIAVIVHPEDRLPSVTLTELREIFSGQRLDWAAVGGQPGPIQVISREDGSGTRAAFEAIVMDYEAVTPTAIVLPNSQAVVDFVAKTPGAIAYVSLSFAAGQNVSSLPIEGVACTLENLQAGTYPLARDLAFVVPARSQSELNRFVEFALSPAGQQLISGQWARIR